MLSCREVTQRASAFLDRELRFSVRLQIRLHLLMCRFCSEYMRQLRQVINTLPQLPREEKPVAARSDVLDAFRASRKV
jgi:hypothetical protein